MSNSGLSQVFVTNGVSKITSTDNSVSLNPSSGVGVVDLSIPASNNVKSITSTNNSVTVTAVAGVNNLAVNFPVSAITSTDNSVSISSNAGIVNLSVATSTGVQAITSLDGSLAITSNAGVDNLQVNFPTPAVKSIISTDNSVTISKVDGDNNLSVNFPLNPTYTTATINNTLIMNPTSTIKLNNSNGTDGQVMSISSGYPRWTAPPPPQYSYRSSIGNALIYQQGVNNQELTISDTSAFLPIFNSTIYDSLVTLTIVITSYPFDATKPIPTQGRIIYRLYNSPDSGNQITTIGTYSLANDITLLRDTESRNFTTNVTFFVPKRTGNQYVGSTIRIFVDNLNTGASFAVYNTDMIVTQIKTNPI